MESLSATANDNLTSLPDLSSLTNLSHLYIENNPALSMRNEGYDDWYLPSIDELIEMHNNIGNGSSIMENYGDLGLSYSYNSSTEIDGNHNADLSSSVGGPEVSVSKNLSRQIRAVRYIGDWIAGCMDGELC